MEEKLTAGRKAHLYAMMAWSDISLEDALKVVKETPYADLDGKTWAETSISQALEGLKKHLGVLESAKPEDDFSNEKVTDIEETYDKVVEILAEIHDKWVKENAKKYNRGTEEKSDKNLFQHTPTALIGLDEVSKDLMFLAPFMEEMGLDAGEMQLQTYGAFVPSEKIASAYQRYVENYMQKNGIETAEGLEEHVKNCINGGYEPLAVVSEISEQRIKYMNAKTDKILDKIMAKNQAQLGSLPSELQPE